MTTSRTIETPAMGATIQNAAVTLEVTQAITDGLNSIPPTPDVDFPGQGTFLTSFGKTAVSVLAFLGTALALKDTWDSAKELYYAENKNFEKVAKLAINLFRTAVVGVFFASLITGAALALPILLPISAALGGAWCLYTAVKKAYQAYKAHQEGNKTERNTLLKESGLNFIAATINGLGTYASIAVTQIGAALKTANDMFNDGVAHWNFPEILAAIDLTQTAGRVYEAFKPVAYALGALLTLGTASSLVANANRQFDETIESLKNPRDSIKRACENFAEGAKKVGSFIKNSYGFGIIPVLIAAPIVITSKVLTVAASITQVVLAAPIRALSYLWDKIRSCGSNSEQEPLLPKVSAPKPDLAQQRALYEKLKTKVQDQKAHLDQQTNDSKHAAKKLVVDEIAQSLGRSFEEYRPVKVDALEKQAKEKSSLVYQSFFRDVSRTKEIVELAKALNNSTPGLAH